MSGLSNIFRLLSLKTASRPIIACQKSLSSYGNVNTPRENTHVTLPGNYIANLTFAPKGQNGYKLNNSLLSEIDNKCLDFIRPEYIFPLNPSLPLIDEDLDRLEIGDCPVSSDNVIEAHKHDIIWRRRRMSRHKLLRWRKRQPKLYRELLKRRVVHRKNMLNKDLTNAWKQFGLKEEPPKLSNQEKKQLVKSWQEKGLWDESISEEEYNNYARIMRIRAKTDLI